MSISNCNTVNFETCGSGAVNVDTDYSISATWEAGGKPVKLQNYTFEGSIKNSLGGTVLIELPTVSDDQTTGLYIPDPSTGVIFIQIKNEDMPSPGKYPFRIMRTTPNGDIQVHMQGEYTFFTSGY